MNMTTCILDRPFPPEWEKCHSSFLCKAVQVPQHCTFFTPQECRTTTSAIKLLLRTYFSMLKPHVIIFRGDFQSFKLVTFFKLTPRYSTKRFHNLDVLLEQQEHSFPRTERVCGTQNGNPGSLQSPSVLRNHVGERNWFFISTPGHPRNTLSTALPLTNLQLTLTCTHMMQHDKCSPSSLKPSRIFIPIFSGPQIEFEKGSCLVEVSKLGIQW